jgi:broad specificity phosphatase PhoE
VILVRHAMPEVVPGLPPAEWHLGDEGRAAARALARRIGPVGEIVTSDEPKAVETAYLLGGTIRRDRRLREVDRPPVWDDGYEHTARRYLEGAPIPGWEPRDAVVERMAAAATADVVVTHGLAMTLYLGEGVRFWEELRFPDAWSALAGHLRRVH